MEPRSALRAALLSAICVAAFCHVSFAAVVGTNFPASSLTAERVATLPEWRAYFEKSQRQRAADREAFIAELRASLTVPLIPPGAHAVKGIKLDMPAPWYGGTEARRVAHNIVSFQTPAGGWGKNLDMTKHSRAPGESFTTENRPFFVLTNDFDLPTDAGWDYAGTFDNGATTTQLRFLAKVTAAGDSDSKLRQSLLRGLDYILAAQFPNGGWPQVWPLQGGYHDAITFNDGAMLHLIELLRDVSLGQAEFSFVPPQLRAKAGASFRRGLDCLLVAQIKVAGKLTAWCQQYDPLTLEPAPARNYEMRALSSAESADIVLFLMDLPQVDARIAASVHGACAWFEKTKITGREVSRTGAEGRRLIVAQGAGPLWSRFYEIGTDRPIFGDRDKSIHDDVNGISQERRNGYGWYRGTPERVLEDYARWSKAHP
jgi:PelA/Pel-15E family pectate lyase